MSCGRRGTRCVAMRQSVAAVTATPWKAPLPPWPRRVGRMDDVWFELLKDSRESPRRRQIDLRAWRQWNQVSAFRHPAIELSARMCHQRGAVPSRAKPHHGMHDLALTATPGARRVYME